MFKQLSFDHASIRHTNGTRLWWRTLGVPLLLLTCALDALAAYPDLRNVAQPNPEPALPAGCDIFVPPVDSSTPDEVAPAFAEWTHSGAPDDLLVITGANFSSYTGADAGKDTQFLAYAQTGSSGGILADAAIHRLNDSKVTIALDGSLPAWSTYFIWAKNEYGYGYPIAVNRTETWWLGPKKAVAGSTTSVFGRNLAYANGTASSYVYVKPASGAGQWATVTAVNPYKVDFIIPSLTNGTYEVWVHNGHGGHYGWSGPLSLTIYSGPGWTSTDFNVRNYGALGDGVTDDTLAIRSAITAASKTPYSSVYFPAGTYAVSDELSPTSNMRFRGAGKALSVIKCLPNYTGHSPIFNIFPISNVEIRDLTVDTAGNYQNPTYGVIFMRGVTDLQFINVAVNAKNTTAVVASVDLNLSNNVSMVNCDITGRQMFLGMGAQLFITGCNFYSSNDATTCIHEWGRCELSMVNSTGQDQNSSLDDGCGQGRFFTGLGAQGVSRNVYLGGNTTYNLGPRPAYSNQNTGEQFMWEGNVTKYRGVPTTASGTTVTFGDLSTDYTGQEAVIVGGRGLGQHRQITAWSSSTQTISVAPAWNLTPDATSTVIITWGTFRNVIYNNYLDSKDFAATTSTSNAMTGVEPYGGCSEFIVDNNTFHQMRYGTYLSCRGQLSPTPIDIEPCYFNLIANNQYQYNRWAMECDVTGSTTASGLIALGNTFRRNTITDPVLMGGLIRTNTVYDSIRMDMVTYEHNIGDNVPVAFDLSTATQTTNHIFYKNDMDRGSAASAGSKGVYLAAGQNVALGDNIWSGFETTYAGTLPGAVLEVPYRYLTASSTAYGVPVTETLTLWNAGTSLLGWNASSDSSWLTLSATSGTVANENSESLVIITCNPANLNVGTYTGTITVTSGGQTHKVTVDFTVLNPTPSLTGLQLWVKGDAGVVVDGSNNVSQWNDQSGNGNNLTPCWMSRSPRYVSSGINNLPTIEFYRLNNNLRKILSTPLPGSFSVFVVCSSPNPQLEQYNPLNNRIVSCPTTNSEDYQQGIVISPTTGAAFSPILRQYTKTLTIGQSIKTFGFGAMCSYNDNAGGWTFTGYISEILIYNRLLTTQESLDVATYLRNKYSLL